MKTYEFDTTIIKHQDMNAAYIEFPYVVQREFGTNGLVRVVATFDGCQYKGALANMGGSCHVLGLTKQVRLSIGKGPGDIVHVVLHKDDQPRIVDIPEDLAQVLAGEPEAKAFWESLSDTNKKEYAAWIHEAKRPETRERRLQETLERLRDRQTRR